MQQVYRKKLGAAIQTRLDQALIEATYIQSMIDVQRCRYEVYRLLTFDFEDARMLARMPIDLTNLSRADIESQYPELFI
ncbi:MAG: hypothetical protein PVF17_01485 [Ignavibacteria bacterium]|jgi:hypothetical protein